MMTLPAPTDDEHDNEPSVEELVRARLIRRAEDWITTLRTSRASVPQVRTVRTRVAAAKELVGLVAERLETVHELAYDRTKAASAQQERVRGGARDYALDTNGDPRARELYRATALELVQLLEVLSIAAHELVTFTRSGEIDTVAGRRARAVAPDEILAALAAAERRAARGEGARPSEDQPMVRTPAVADLQARIRSLENVIAKTIPRLKGEERGRLTTAEVMEHRLAVDGYNARRESRGKPAVATS